MLGYGGHFLTKSRRYSTTFGSPPPRPHRAPPSSSATPAANATPGAAPSTSTVVLVLHTWTYAGTGYPTTPGAELALASAAMARAHRQAATAA